jgi:trk system potassium uptake protein TrkH
MRPDAQLLNMVMMFIGGSPASTAGGIKTTTLVVLIMTAVSMIRGRCDTAVLKRNVSTKVVREAIVIFLLAASCILFIFGILLMTEHSMLTNGRTAMDLLFETISAFATVGLTTGITPALSILGKLCVALCMFVGRLGPLTIALIIGATETTIQIRYPQEEVVVG